MAARRNDLMNLMKSLNIDQGTFTDDELKMFEHGGIPLSDSESEGMRGSVSIADIDDYPKYGQSGGKQQMPNMQDQNKHFLQKYNSIIAMLEKQNGFLNAEIKRISAGHDAEKQRIFSNHRIESDKLLSEIKQLKSKLAYQDAQMPGLREALIQVRDMLAGLVPESVYLKLRDMSEKDLPLQDWVLVQVWELVYPFKKESEFQRKEILALREEIKQMGDKSQQMLNELEHGQKMIGDREEDYKRYKLNYENARKSLEMELTKMNEEVVLLREKGMRFDELNREFRRLEQEKQLLEEKMGFNMGGDKGGGNDALREKDESKRKGDLLAQDKEYLTKENIQLTEKLKRLEDKLDKAEREYIEAKNQAQEYLFQLLNVKNEAMQSYEKRIYSELSDIKEKHQHELESAKQNLIDIYEKQISFLKEAKEEQEIRKENLEGQVKEKQHSYETLLIDYRTLQRRVEGDLSELRISVRLKAEELERIQNIYEETLANLKATKHENEMLREKINVLKSEYYKTQVDAKEEMSHIRAQLQVAKEQLSNYEGIEREIDEAIMKSAGQDYDPNNPLLGMMGSVPTSSKRRIQQSLNLAQRLQAKQREVEQLYRQIREKDSEIEKLKEDVSVQKDVIDKVHQPHSYLVQHIEERDRDILKYKQALKRADQEYGNLKAEYDDLKERYERAEEDLQRLKVKRETIQNIQNILLSMASGSPQEMKQNLRGALNQISEALQTGQYMDPIQFQKPKQQKSKHSKAPSPPQRDQDAPEWYRKLKSQKKR